MKFSSPLSFSKKGICFKHSKYHLFFPWANPFNYEVITYAMDGVPYKNSSKLKGFEYPELISEWVSMKYPLRHLIVLSNISIEAKNIQFWAKVPKTDILHFVKDVVILHCKDKSEVLRLVENIPSSFADAQGYSAGISIIHNKDN